jgi:hypothetical protein
VPGGKMTSKKASYVKQLGHKKEDDIAKQFGCCVITGHTKPDICLMGNGNICPYAIGNKVDYKHCINCVRYQLALLSPNSIKSIPYVGNIFYGWFQLINKEPANHRALEKDMSSEVVEILQGKDEKMAFISHILYGDVRLSHICLFNDNKLYYLPEKKLKDDLMSCEVVLSGRGGRKVIFKNNRNILEVERRGDKNCLLVVSTAKNIRRWVVDKSDDYIDISNMPQQDFLELLNKENIHENIRTGTITSITEGI